MKKITHFLKQLVALIFLLITTILNAQVGIGTITPSTRLEVEANAASDGITINNVATDGDPILKYQVNGSSVISMGVDDSDADKFKIGTTAIDVNTRMTFAANGYIGFTTTTPATNLHYRNDVINNNFHTMWDFNNVSDAIARAQSLNPNNGSRGWFGITNYSGTALAANGLMGLALNGSGNASGVEGYSNSNSGTGLLGGFIGGNFPLSPGWAVYANGWAGGITAWQNFSDRRLKRNITTINGAIEKIKNLRGVEYYYDNSNFPDLNFDTQTKQMGFIAQEIEEVFPELVRDSNLYASSEKMDNGYSREQKAYQVKSLSYTLLIPVLVEATKEQQQIIETQNAKIESLEQKLELLNKKVDNLLNTHN